jgi:hypothetical protein
MSSKWCKFCSNKIEKYTLKISKNTTKKQFENHEHIGNAVYKYGICCRQHYTKLEMEKIQWRLCIVCDKKKEKMDERRKYLETKARMEQREIPSFLRDELDRFVSRMEKNLEKKFEKELQKRIEKEVSYRLGSKFLREDFSTTSLIDLEYQVPPSPPSLPSGLSPPSAPSSDDGNDSDYTTSSMSAITCSAEPPNYVLF